MRSAKRTNAEHDIVCRQAGKKLNDEVIIGPGAGAKAGRGQHGLSPVNLRLRH